MMILVDMLENKSEVICGCIMHLLNTNGSITHKYYFNHVYNNCCMMICSCYLILRISCIYVVNTVATTTVSY
jgi:hypothetical protein